MTSVVAERPVCECHGEPMRWSKDPNCKAGGRWRCSVDNRERARRWREANPDKKREDARRWREANPEKERERKRRWGEANPDKQRERNARRLQWRTGGTRTSVYLPTVEDKERFVMMIAAKRAEQQAEYAQFTATLKEA